MEKHVSQQQTLFRFTSIRPPQLIKDEDKPLKLVEFHLTESIFYDAVKNRPDTQTKKEALTITSESFSGYQSSDEVKAIFPDLYSPAQWISIHKSNFDVDELYHMIEELSTLTTVKVRGLWDNIFYQVITQKDFYVKEDLFAVLVLNNMVDQIKKISNPERSKAVLPLLANARVVLPLELFSDYNDSLSLHNPETSEDPIFSTKNLARASEAAISQDTVQRSTEAVNELTKLQQKYYQKYEKDFDTTVKTYKEEVVSAYEHATPIEKERILCPSGCPEKYIEYDNLSIPKFDFVPPLEVSPQILKQKLSEESYYIVEFLKLEEESTFAAILSGIREYIKKETLNVFSNIDNSEKVLKIGNMAFQSMTNNSQGEVFLNDLQVSFIGSFIETSAVPLKGKVQLTLNVGFTGADVVSASFTASFTNGTNITGASFVDSAVNSTLNVILFPNGLTVPAGSTKFTIEATLTLSNGNKIGLNTEIPVKGRSVGIATVVSKITTNNGIAKPFSPNGFGIRRLGIQDYRRVVAEVCCYKEAEVSHIENIMAREFKSKSTTRERVEETTITTENEVEVENLTDTTTSERFEMQSEVAKLMAQQTQLGAYANVKSEMNKVTLETGGNYATNTAKEESHRQAMIQSKEITQRAMERITSRHREEIVKKITERYKEDNSHVFDNRAGEHHVSGVYRFINAIYKNQIFNYGKRLIYEFMIPQPSKLYDLGTSVVNKNASTSLEEVIKPKSPQELNVSDISELDEDNYMNLAAEYGADVETPPSSTITIGKAYQGTGVDGATSREWNDLKVPEGYKFTGFSLNYQHFKSNNNNLIVFLTIANKTVPIGGGYLVGLGNIYQYSVNSDLSPYNLESIPVSITGWDLGSFSLNINANFGRTTDHYNKWKLKTYETIMAAYRQRLDEYYSKLAPASEDSVEYIPTNPLFYRNIEKSILKKNCVEYLTTTSQIGQSYYSGATFSTFQIIQSEPMDKYAGFVKFIEQAFEWDIMSYSFYPFYWGNRAEWKQLYQKENDDPVFRSFMQSGMARVHVTVRPGFEDAVMYYMATGNIWNGGSAPIIGDPLYKSIVDELLEQEYFIDGSWETVVPTSLNALQKSGVALDVEGLPCGGGCEDPEDPNPFTPNSHNLGPETPPTT